MTLDKFKAIVRAIGGVWETQAVTFSKHPGTYAASCGDSVITCQYVDGLWAGRGPHAQGIPFVAAH